MFLGITMFIPRNICKGVSVLIYRKEDMNIVSYVKKRDG